MGVVGAFVEGDRVVYFETRVGYNKPAMFREAFPEEPTQEMDMRFLDENGLTFFAQRGGDQFVDGTWGENIAETFRSDVDAAGRAQDFEMARSAGEAFPGIAEPALVDHTFHLREHGQRLLPSEDPRLFEAENAPRPDSQYGTISGEGGTWDLAGGMMHSSVFLVGSHGSVNLWAKASNGGSWSMQLAMCNHGSCSGSHKCFTYGWGLTDPLISYEHSTSTSNITGACTTSYGWNGGSGKHNSNDDTAYELWQIKEGKTATSRGNDTTFDWNASNKRYACSSNGGRWTAPANCP